MSILYINHLFFFISFFLFGLFLFGFRISFLSPFLPFPLLWSPFFILIFFSSFSYFIFIPTSAFAFYWIYFFYFSLINHSFFGLEYISVWCSLIFSNFLSYMSAFRRSLYYLSSSKIWFICPSMLLILLILYWTIFSSIVNLKSLSPVFLDIFFSSIHSF